MNATIERIVNLLFEDLVENDETSAIREEILQNCQDRYQDLRDAGISEDDAIHAVIESLNGMEEMLNEYPRKADQPVNAPEPPEIEEAEEAEEAEESRCWRHDPAQSPIREIRMENMASADVRVEVSHDQMVHVECSSDKVTLITCLDDGVLTIGLSEQKEAEIKEEIKFSIEDGFDLSSLGRMFERLARRFTGGMGDVEVTLCIPVGLQPALDIHTASGCVEVDPLTLEQLHISTASGDITMEQATVENELHAATASGTIELNQLTVRSKLLATSASGDITLSHVRAAQVQATSASGDIALDRVEAEHLQAASSSGDLEAERCTVQGDARLSSVSGDASWSGDCRSMEASTVSGDLELEGMIETLSFKTGSGDASVTLRGESLLSVSGKTTSGDMEVYLPQGVQANVHCSTRTGDIYNHAGSVPGAPVTVTLSTTSGDIEVN